MSMMVHNGTGWEPWAEETGGGGGPDLTGLVDRSATDLDLSGLGDTGSIGDNVFRDCSSLTSLTLPADMTGSIGASAFRDCSSLTSITLPPGMTGTIGTYAFYNCTSLTSLILPPGMTGTIGTSTFHACPSLTSITLPPGMTGPIGSSAFYGCSSLTSLTLPAGMTGSIGNYAFRNCSALEYLMLRSTSVVALSSTQSLQGTTCLIYVPADLVDAYKTAANWSTLAARIHPIPEALL